MELLPNEILTHICEYIVINGNILTAGLINKHFHSVIMDLVGRKYADDKSLWCIRKKINKYEDKLLSVEKKILSDFVRKNLCDIYNCDCSIMFYIGYYSLKLALRNCQIFNSEVSIVYSFTKSEMCISNSSDIKTCKIKYSNYTHNKITILDIFREEHKQHASKLLTFTKLLFDHFYKHEKIYRHLHSVGCHMIVTQ